MIFADSWILLSIPFIFLFVYLWRRLATHSALRFPSRELFKDFRPNLKLRLAKNLIYLRAAVIVLFILALARARLPLEEAKIQSEGIDIVLAIDCSGSMRALDFKIGKRRQNRLAVAKTVVAEFIQMRENDRIGMIAFAADAYTVCPLTLDSDWLIKNLARVEIGDIKDGTAIGSAISSSLNRLKNTQAKSKIIVLLTDGINNTGKIAPLTAVEVANKLGVKIYTIGVGTKGLVPYPVQGFFGNTVYQNVNIEIDEEILKKIARTSGGEYFRATDTASLRKIYSEIDSLEKTPVEEGGFQLHQELFPRFLIAGLAFLLLEIVITNTILRKIP